MRSVDGMDLPSGSPVHKVHAVHTVHVVHPAQLSFCIAAGQFAQ